MPDKKKIFDDYLVECNECLNYWNNTCDGVKKGSTRTCRSYRATRSFVIPKQLKQLNEKIMINRVLIMIVFVLLGVNLFIMLW